MNTVIFKKQKPFKRGHGILMPIFSLPSPYGIGTLGEPAKKFVDFLEKSGGYMWQVLPLGPTGYGDSPYQCLSAFGGNTYFIDPMWLAEKGWLSEDELKAFVSCNNGKVDYSYLYKTRKKLLKRVYANFLLNAESSYKEDFLKFKADAAFWLQDYATFISLKEKNGSVGRRNFKDCSIKNKDCIACVENELIEAIELAKFLEYVFFTQWRELKDYANKKGIMLVGDIPLYVSDDSADVWANPELFMLDKKGNPTNVAGVPPDIFSKDGQLWGNPLYSWERHKATGYAWWKERIKWQSKLFDVIRIDHFIGICRYYSIKEKDMTAKNGVWKEGPGREIISAFLKAAGKTKFIAEDLGVITEEVRKLVSVSGFPGMKVMQFAFTGADNENLIHKTNPNSVVYTGTHDNNTLKGFLENCSKKEISFAKKYLGLQKSSGLHNAIIRECFKSPANTVIIPLYDYLELSDNARINTPSTLGNNWRWRLTELPDCELAEKIRGLAEIYEREN